MGDDDTLRRLSRKYRIVDGRRRGIPTTHARTRFRSRLEARWAMLFDAIGWRWEYEPFDVDGYVPDFAILGARPLLVEVKPVISIEEIAEHVEKVMRARRDTLIVGVSPLLPDPVWDSIDPASRLPGVLVQWSPGEGPSPMAWPAVARWHRCAAEGCGCASVHHSEGGWTSYPCGHYDGDRYLGVLPSVVLERAWADARNQTQWNPY